MLKYLNIRKILLFLQLLFSYLWSVWTGSNVRWGKYIALSVEPINTCNLSCPQCPTGLQLIRRNQGSLSYKSFKNIIEQKAKDLWYMNFYFQGEPFLNKDLPRMIKLAHQHGIYTSVSTNGQLMNTNVVKQIIDSGLDRIIISIDGATEEVYQTYRIGGKLQKLLDFVEELNKQKEGERMKTPLVVFQFIVFSHNEHEIDAVKKLAKQYKADRLQIKSAQIYDFEKNHLLIPNNHRYSRYKKDNQGKYRIKSKLKNHCWRMFHSAVITEDLDVVPCCFDKDANYVLGNLKEENIFQIEKGNKYSLFRQSILKNRKQHNMCQNCTEGLTS